MCLRQSASVLFLDDDFFSSEFVCALVRWLISITFCQNDWDEVEFDMQ